MIFAARSRSFRRATHGLAALLVCSPQAVLAADLVTDPPAKPATEDRALTVGLTESAEWLRNLHGGLKTGQIFHGLATLTLRLDTARAGGWQGGNFNISAFQIHGRSLTADFVGSLQGASNIEAERATRLWEVWYQQKFGDGLDVRVGQQSIDQEFMASQYSSLFIGPTFGWPALPSYNLPAGGPVYPLSVPGVRVRAPLNETTTLLVGAFAGNPANNLPSQDPQKANARGTTFSLKGGTLLIAELQYGRNQPDSAESGTTATANVNANATAKDGLPGTYKLGAWYHTHKFSDPRFDDGGMSLANPLSSGNALQHSGNYSVYGLADQTVWRESEGGARAVNVFARAMAAPGNRNPISFGANFGVTMSAPFEGRTEDVIGLGVGYLKIGSHLRALDADTNAFLATSQPVRRSETFIEATYQYQLTDHWQVHGTLQYTRNPGAGAVDTYNTASAKKIPNATVVGLRTNLSL